MKDSMLDFTNLPISQELQQVVAELGFTKMTPIQARSIPLLLEGKDLIGQSKTGSGKTVAFSLPILEKLNLAPGEHRQLQALVLCPTRELCTQVAREIRKLGRRHPGLQVLALSGGQPIFPQLCALEKGIHIAVGTPGRVLDHVNRGTLDLSRVSTLVLDEADRMLDMGFEEDMKKILAALPSSRQTVFFSATFPKTIEALSRSYQRNPARATIREEEVQASSIRQVWYQVDPETKLKAVLWLLQQFKPESAIVFCNFKASVVEIESHLRASGISSASIHGDLEQYDRDRVMAKFRNLSTSVLVATDVAARGIDIENLDLVINYEIPAQPEVYVHRIGRTGRAGKQGVSVSLASSREKPKIERIESFNKIKITRKELPSLEKADLDSLAGSAKRDAKMRTLYIAAGRKDKMRPGDILGALTGEAGGLSGSTVGKIEIHDRFSYVAVSSEIAELALTRLRNGRIKGRKVRVEAVK